MAALSREQRSQAINAVQQSMSDSGLVSTASRDDYIQAIRAALAQMPDVQLSGQDLDAAINDIYDQVGPGRLGPLEPLLAESTVTEIMVNGPKEVWAEVDGRIRRARATFDSDAAIRAAIDRIVSADNKLCDEGHPMCDCVLHRPGEACDQSRVNTVVPPIAVDHPLIDIRKFRKDVDDLDALRGLGTLNDGVERFLKCLVAARMNILITGGTGTGKTTLLNALAGCIDSSERIITIEDTAELSIDKPQVVRMTSRQANAEGKGEVTIRRLVQNALRQRPDRIIVGECRGDETMEMLQAMSTGHDGSLSTVHANSTRDALDRLNVLVHYSSDLSENIVKQIIASAVDYIISLERFEDGSRKICEITEVLGYSPENSGITTSTIWRFENEGLDKAGRVVGQFQPTMQIPSERSQRKFRAAHLDVPTTWFLRGQ